MPRISVARDAEKELRKLPPKHQRQVSSCIARLGQDPQPHDSVEMKGKAHGHHRVDVGEYRIIYRIEPEEVLVLTVGSRNDDAVYRAFARKLRS